MIAPNDGPEGYFTELARRMLPGCLGLRDESQSGGAVMEHSQIVALAQDIANHSVTDALLYWMVLLALGFLACVAGGFFGSWSAKRGEVAAARDAQREILSQLRETTRVAEETKSVVSLGEWSERERRSLRRSKLEELVLLAHKTLDWLTEQTDRLWFEEGQASASPGPTMMMLGNLYFAELGQPLREYEVAWRAYHKFLLDIRKKMWDERAKHAAGSGAADVAAWSLVAPGTPAFDERAKRYELAYERLHALDGAAAGLMKTIIAPPS